MKVLPFKIPLSESQSFRIQVDEAPYFYDRFHHHQELQITLIEKSHGTLLIGNSISTFQEGDLFVIGANVPHCFKNDSSFYDTQEASAKSTSVFFNGKSFGQGFFQLPELKKVRVFLNEADKGIQIEGETKMIIQGALKGIKSQKGLSAILSLLNMLDILSQSKDIRHLSSIGFSIQSEMLGSEKLEAIFQYVSDHYDRRIKLEEVAAIANLSVSAFCRFFKTRTRKTFSRFVNEFRISIACKHLLSGNYNVSEICYEVGFSNLSNFNRQFKLIKGYAPSTYIELYK